MTASVVTADLGNSRLKLRAWRLGDGPAVRVGALELAGGPDALTAGAAGWLREHADGARGALCSVAAPALEARVAEALEAACGSFLRAPAPGLELRVREPEQVGRDRLFAARGALAELGASCLVVDAGTALTVDAVLALPEPDDGRSGAFLGGAIAPGPVLQAEALSRGAARLPRVEPRPGAAALGRGTAEAILAGVVVGFRGAARELVRRIAAEAELPGAPIVLTGGARAVLLEPEPFVPDPLVREDLVHLGLLDVLAGP